MAADKPSSNEEWITFSDDGHKALLDTAKTPMYDGENTLIGVLGIGRDITERKRAEQELQRYSEHLETLVTERTAELQAKSEELKQKYLDLERFNDLFVGRELRMVELKERITELEKQEKSDV